MIKLGYLLNIQVDIFSLLVCSLILLDACKRIEMHLEQKIFIAILASTMVLLVLDIMSWVLEGRVGDSYIHINSLGYVLYYALHSVPPFLWVLYTDCQIFNDKKSIRRLFWPFGLPLVILAALAFTNPLTGYMFQLDTSNVYHRGPWFFLLIVLAYTYLAYTLLLVFYHRKKITKAHFLPLLLFALPPAIGGILQVYYYGFSLIWSGMTLSLLMVYLNIQNRRMGTDYLTGVNNRLHFDRHLLEKIRSSVQRPFAGILIDIDDFKKINDVYGHDVGDEALSATASLIKKSLRKDDFLARYGGDEFIVLLNIQNLSDLEKSIDRIKQSISGFNLTGERPFKLKLSMGYDVYDPHSEISGDQFLKHIDELMYKNKNKHKAGILTASGSR